MVMRQHPREPKVTVAERELAVEIDRVLTKHQLTRAESLRVVNAAASNWIAGLAKYGIREERHQDADTPGGASYHKNGCGDPSCEGCK